MLDESAPMSIISRGEAFEKLGGLAKINGSLMVIRECSLMVKPLPSKQMTRVRFPSLAPLRRRI